MAEVATWHPRPPERATHWYTTHDITRSPRSLQQTRSPIPSSAHRHTSTAFTVSMNERTKQTHIRQTHLPNRDRNANGGQALALTHPSSARRRPIRRRPCERPAPKVGTCRSDRSAASLCFMNYDPNEERHLDRSNTHTSGSGDGATGFDVRHPPFVTGVVLYVYSFIHGSSSESTRGLIKEQGWTRHQPTTETNSRTNNQA